jgi:hypothetical protein
MICECINNDNIRRLKFCKESMEEVVLYFLHKSIENGGKLCEYKEQIEKTINVLIKMINNEKTNYENLNFSREKKYVWVESSNSDQLNEETADTLIILNEYNMIDIIGAYEISIGIYVIPLLTIQLEYNKDKNEYTCKDFDMIIRVLDYPLEKTIGYFFEEKPNELEFTSLVPIKENKMRKVNVNIIMRIIYTYFDCTNKMCNKCHKEIRRKTYGVSRFINILNEELTFFIENIHIQIERIKKEISNLLSKYKENHDILPEDKIKIKENDDYIKRCEGIISKYSPKIVEAITFLKQQTHRTSDFNSVFEISNYY